MSARAVDAKVALTPDELRIRHNLAGLSTWQEPEWAAVDSKMDGPCAHDAFLRRLCEVVKADAETKVMGGISVNPLDS